MKFRITIGQKLLFGFGFISTVFLFFIISTSVLLTRNETINNKIATVNLPSESSLNELETQLFNSMMLLKNWVYIDQKTDTHDKLRLKKILANDFPTLMESIKRLKKHWGKDEQAIIDDALISIQDTLFEQYDDIMKQLHSYDSYSNPMITATIYPLVEENGELRVLFEQITAKVASLRMDIESTTKESTTQMEEALASFRSFILIFGTLALLLSIIIALLLIKSIVNPILLVQEQLEKLSQGEISKKTFKKRNDELGDLITALEKTTEVLTQTSAFAQEIGKGNYNSDFSPKSKKDVLGNALISLQNSLETASREAEERREDDRISNWTTNGLANFAELLRKSNNISTLSKTIITELVNYMEINQGGIFVINEDDKEDVYLEMLACYAYGRDRFSKRRLDLGEGIVGTTFLEKETVLMTDVPQGYTEITSGLGEATPSCIMVVPLKTDDKILGVIELASFNKFQEFEKDFVEKIAASIATTIINAKVAEETSKLLELSNVQTQKMIDQEDMMKQNIEELECTQEEAAYIRSQMEEQLKEAQLEIEKLKSELERE